MARKAILRYMANEGQYKKCCGSYPLWKNGDESQYLAAEFGDVFASCGARERLCCLYKHANGLGVRLERQEDAISGARPQSAVASDDWKLLGMLPNTIKCL